jgi:hypothetical protein
MCKITTHIHTRRAVERGSRGRRGEVEGVTKKTDRILDGSVIIGAALYALQWCNQIRRKNLS